MDNKKKIIIYGRHPISTALKSGQGFDKILLQQGTRGEFEKEIRSLCRKFNIPLQVAPKERLNRITNANHQGIIGYASLLSYYKIENVLPGIYEKGEIPLLLILDGITDVRNFGSIARSAEVMGVHAIIFSKKGTAQINSDTIKTSAGALLKIPLCREGSLVNTIKFLQNSGIQVFASDLQSSKHLSKLNLSDPLAFVIGSEGKGVSHTVLEKVDERFIIPQKGTTDSLNVSVATGIMLYQVNIARS